MEIDGWWVQFVGSFVALVAALLVYGFNRLVAYLVSKTEEGTIKEEAIQALLEGMARAQDEIVREAKMSSADGKLTKDEISKAQELAYSHAVAVAMGPAKDILLAWGKERASSLIKQLLAKYRG